MVKKVCVSGYFNPLHIGHIKYMEEAAKFGELTVILNSDDAAKRKSGFSFMPWEERKYIIERLKFVNEVVSVDDSDGTVCEAIRRIKPDVFCKGGDRGPDNTPEKEVCEWMGIEMKFGVGGDDKAQASSRLVEKAVEAKLANAGITEYQP